MDQTKESDNATFLSWVITGGESWIYSYDRGKATILPMEKSKFSETKKGEIGEEQSQEHVRNFLQHQRDCSQTIRRQTVNSAYCYDVLW
jgi:hypothetical protein